MTVLDLIALLILVIIAFLIGALLCYLGGLPGRVAKERNHPYQQAIAVGGWSTMILGGVAWPLVLMWAYAPFEHGDSESRSAEQEDKLRNELESLRTQVERLTKQVQAHRGPEQ